MTPTEGKEVGEFRRRDGGRRRKGGEEGEDAKGSSARGLVVDREEFRVGFDQVRVPGRGRDLRGTSRVVDGVGSSRGEDVVE